MKEEVSLLSADVTNLTSLTKQIYRLTDDLTEMVKDMKTNERMFQKRVLNEIGKIFLLKSIIFTIPLKK